MRAPLLGTLLALAISLAASGEEDVIVWSLGGLNEPSTARFLDNGDFLIADKWNNRLIQVTAQRPSGSAIGWTYAGAQAPDSGRRLANGHTLVMDTVGNRALEVDAAGATVWSYGAGTQGCSDNELYLPSDVLDMSGDRLIVDQGHGRLLRVTLGGTIVWRYGDPGCAQGSGLGQLNGPFAIDLMPNGDVLVSDVGDHWVGQIHPVGTSGGTIVWEYGIRGTAGSLTNELASPDRAVPLANGNVLIADTDNQRIIEVTPTPPFGGNIVWQYGTTGATGSAFGFLDGPYDAERGPRGSTLIVDQSNNRVFEVSPLVLRFQALQTNFSSGSCAGPFELGVADVYDTAQPPTASIAPALGATPNVAAYYSDAACTVPLGSGSLVGTTPQTLYVRPGASGGIELRASSPGYRDGRLTVTFGDAGSQDNPSSPTDVNAAHFLVSCGCHSGGSAFMPWGVLVWGATLFGVRRKAKLARNPAR